MLKLNNKTINSSLPVKTSTQKFEYKEINRSKINVAPYNPRNMTDHARKALNKGIDDFGVVEPLIWNKQTGNLVGGHQRLKKMDEEEKYPKVTKDYIVGVSMVNLNLKREKKLNVLLNALGAQGFFDQESLFDLLKEFKEDDLGSMGLTKMNLELDFGMTPLFADVNVNPEMAASIKSL